MRITAENTICIVIDYQEKLVPAMANKEEMLRHSSILLKGLKAIGVPCVVTTQYAKGLGNTIAEIAEIIEGSPIVDKNTFSVFENDEVLAQIPDGTKNIIICGMESHICVLQSVMDAQAKGYHSIYVADCVSSRFENDAAFALVRAEKEGAIITTAEAILYELLGGSKHPAFKEISSLVK